MEVTVAEAPTREQHAAMQAEIASAAQDLLALGQEAVEARCLAATRAMAGPSGKIALETLLATTKYQLQATGEFAMPEPLLQDVSQKLWVKTDCGDPEKITLANVQTLPGNKGVEHLLALERCLGLSSP